MTAQELIEILSGLEPDTEIYVKHRAGDYWKTELASKIEDGEFVNIEYSDYHRQDKISENEDGKEVYTLEINNNY